MDPTPHGIPWLSKPISLHSDRDSGPCDLPTAAECAWESGWWRNWYQADHHYALPTVAFFLTAIVLIAIPATVVRLRPETAHPGTPRMRKMVAASRYFSYKTFSIRLPLVDHTWTSAPLGALFLGAVGAIFFFSMTLGPRPYYWPNTATIHYGNSMPIATRSGWMALGCLPFIIATSSKSNLITLVTGISHERLQPFHRWSSYAAFVLALIHTFPFIVTDIWTGRIRMEWTTGIYYWTGVVALLAQAWLTFASMSPLRNWHYEIFKFTHFLAALIFVLFFFFHCDFTLTSADYFIATGVIFALTWLHSQIRVWFEHGVGRKASVEVVANGFVRVGVPVSSTWKCGQHFFVRFLGAGVTHVASSHPFTACSLPTRARGFAWSENELVFFIRPQGGLTKRLARWSEKNPGRKMRILLDGPYGGIDMPKLATCQKLLVIAGGSGAGWCLPLIEAFLRRKDCAECCDPSKETDACDVPSMKVVLATRDLATRDWFEEAVSELISTSLVGRCPPGLVVEVHYTGGADNAAAPKVTGQFLQTLDDPEKAPDTKIRTRRASGSDSDDAKAEEDERFALSLKDVQGRPPLPSIVRQECSAGVAGASVGVFVCGPRSMQSDVADAVAREQIVGMKDGRRDIYLHREHFAWA